METKLFLVLQTLIFVIKLPTQLAIADLATSRLEANLMKM
jgi:hypothetical protein